MPLAKNHNFNCKKPKLLNKESNYSKGEIPKIILIKKTAKNTKKRIRKIQMRFMTVVKYLTQDLMHTENILLLLVIVHIRNEVLVLVV